MSLIKCTECAQDISSEAKMCPHCGKPNKVFIVEQTSKKRDTIKAVIGFIVVGLVIAGLYFGPNVIDRIRSAHVQQTIVNNTTSQPAPIQTSIKNIGDTFVLGDIQYKILSAKNLGNDLSKYNNFGDGVIGMGTTQGNFIEIKIHAENIGKDEVGVNKISVVDSDDRKFDFSVNPSAMLSISGYEMYGMYPDYEGVKPGLSEDFVALFEVSKQSSGLKLDFPDYYGRTAFQIPLGL
jgi:hypothetical protein